MLWNCGLFPPSWFGSWFFFFLSVSGNVSLPAKTSDYYLLFSLVSHVQSVILVSTFPFPLSVLPPHLTLVSSLISAQLIYNHHMTPPITKSWVASTVDIHFAQFWSLSAPRLRCQHIWCMVRTCFLVHRWASSFCVLTWQRVSERERCVLFISL